MYCPSCGKSIPDESKFCLHCGVSVHTGKPASPSIVPSDKPPKYIKGIGCSLSDIVQGNRHGFSVWFQLVDADGKPTRADGKVTIKISDAGMIWSDFKQTIRVQKKEFFQSTNDPTFFGYQFKHPTPALMKPRYGYETEITFKTAEGKIIKGST